MENSNSKSNIDESRGRNENASEEECALARKRLNRLFQQNFHGNRTLLRKGILIYSTENPRIARLRSTPTWPSDTKIINRFQSGAGIERGNLEFLLHYLDSEEASSL